MPNQLQRFNHAADEISEFLGMQLRLMPNQRLSHTMEYAVLSPTGKTIITLMLSAHDDGSVKLSGCGQTFMPNYQAVIGRILRGDKPWDGRPNFFSLYSDHRQFSEAQQAIIDIADRVWSAIKSGDGEVIPALQADFKAVTERYAAVGAHDTEPRAIMASVVLRAGKRGHFSLTQLEVWATGFQWGIA